MDWLNCDMRLSAHELSHVRRNMTYTPRRAKWNWREHLTIEELAILRAADKAKAAWLKLNKERAGITNRAIQRAKYAARSGQTSKTAV